MVCNNQLLRQKWQWHFDARASHCKQSGYQIRKKPRRDTEESGMRKEKKLNNQPPSKIYALKWHTTINFLAREVKNSQKYCCAPTVERQKWLGRNVGEQTTWNKMIQKSALQGTEIYILYRQQIEYPRVSKRGKVQLNWTPYADTRKIYLPWHREGYDKSKTKHEKLSLRLIQWYVVKFHIVFFEGFLKNIHRWKVP